MLLLIGPATGLGHTSMVYMIESQLNYLVDWLRKARSRGIVRTEVKADAQERYNAGIQHKLRGSVWVNGGCASWYKDSHGNITTLWPGFTFNYRNETRQFDLSAFDVARGADAPSAGAPATATETVNA